jgi:hypothetical protein
MRLIPVDADETANAIVRRIQRCGNWLRFRFGGQQSEGDGPKTLSDDEENVGNGRAGASIRRPG